MTKITFTFIAALLLLLALFSGGLVPSPSQELFICLAFVFLAGIPHGAIDNILFMRKTSISRFRFYTSYLGAILANVLIWIISPAIGISIFLAISAFHFGQSQFSHHLNGSSWIHNLLMLSWGVSIISGLIYWNLEEIMMLINSTTFFDLTFFTIQKFYILFQVSTLITCALLIYLTIKGSITIEILGFETFILALIHLSFFALPLLTGFTLYFVVLHSIKVLKEEYEFLFRQKIARSLMQFVKLLLPFTLVSLFGMALILSLIKLEVFELHMGYVLLILVSSITVPHTYVMNFFYYTGSHRTSGFIS